MQELALVKIDGGFRVRETEKYYIDILPMLSTLRLALRRKGNPDPWEMENAWCYSNNLIEVVLRCLSFDPDAGEIPEGWIKEVPTERRACYHLIPRGKHREFSLSCAHCVNQKAAEK